MVPISQETHRKLCVVFFKHFYEAEYAKTTGFRCAVASLNADGRDEPAVDVFDFYAGEIRDDTDKDKTKVADKTKVVGSEYVNFSGIGSCHLL